MYPYYVLGLPLDCSDNDVDERYHELLQVCAPEQRPAEFMVIREAYEAVRTHKQRLGTYLFYRHEGTRELRALRRSFVAADRQRRLSVEELTRALGVWPASALEPKTEPAQP